MAEASHSLSGVEHDRFEGAFRPLCGVNVLVKSLPIDVLEATQATTETFALLRMSGGIDPQWLGAARSPSQLAARFSVGNTVAASDIPIHVEVSHTELGLWQLDPKSSMLAFFPRVAEDLQHVQYGQGFFGAIVVDFTLYQDDLQQAITWLIGLKTAVGEIVAVAPFSSFHLFDGLGRSPRPYDATRTTPVRIVESIAVIFGQEVTSPNQRFNARNNIAAWCEALDYASLSPRLELKDRTERIGGISQSALTLHYRLRRSFSLYRRFANRINALDSALDVLVTRAGNDFEYLRWKYLRRFGG
jgi:hypothetical protein